MLRGRAVGTCVREALDLLLDHLLVFRVLVEVQRAVEVHERLLRVPLRQCLKRVGGSFVKSSNLSI